MLERFHSEFQTYIQTQYSDKSVLSEACRYALEGPGKRVRPQLLMLAQQIFSDRYRTAIPAAIAVEMVHTYSLVHDDLPVMDNDDYRRGRLTVHKVYDEATALLVGDALLSDAFACLTNNTLLSAEQNLNMVRELSEAVGGRGMVLGQNLDLFWTAKNDYSFEDLNSIHRNKTGKLFAASCALGAIAGGASSHEVDILRKVGEDFGLAFQIMDDLIDENEGTGKSVGKDKALGKLTYLKFMDSHEAFSKASVLMEEICKSLQIFGDKGSSLSRFLTALSKRKS